MKKLLKDLGKLVLTGAFVVGLNNFVEGQTETEKDSIIYKDTIVVTKYDRNKDGNIDEVIEETYIQGNKVSTEIKKDRDFNLKFEYYITKTNHVFYKNNKKNTLTYIATATLYDKEKKKIIKDKEFLNEKLLNSETREIEYTSMDCGKGKPFNVNYKRNNYGNKKGNTKGNLKYIYNQEGELIQKITKEKQNTGKTSFIRNSYKYNEKGDVIENIEEKGILEDKINFVEFSAYDIDYENEVVGKTTKISYDGDRIFEKEINETILMDSYKKINF